VKKTTKKPRRRKKLEMVVAKITVNEASLRQLTADEQNLFILLSVAANELDALVRIVTVAGHGDSRREIHDDFITCQYLTVLKVYAGKLHEIWMLLRKRFYASRLSENLHSELTASCQASLDFLKRYFGASNNIITTMRNEFAFHYTDQDVQASLNSLIDGKSHIYLGAYYRQIKLYYAGEVAFHNHLFGSIQAESGKSPREVHEEIAMVGGVLSSVLDEIIFSLILKLTDAQANTMEVEWCSIKQSASLKKSKIPVFFDPIEYSAELRAHREENIIRQELVEKISEGGPVMTSRDKFLKALSKRKIKF
jgi:hypothetical protein